MLTFALSGGGPPAGAWSKAAEAVDGTSNDTVGSTASGTANGIRSHGIYAVGGDRPHGLLQLSLIHISEPTRPY